MIININQAKTFNSGELQALEQRTLKHYRDFEEAFVISPKSSKVAAFTFLFLSGIFTGIWIMLTIAS